MEVDSRLVRQAEHRPSQLRMASNAACLQTGLDLASRGALFLDSEHIAVLPLQCIVGRRNAIHSRPAANCCIHISRALVLDTAPQSICQPHRRSPNPLYSQLLEASCSARTIPAPGQNTVPSGLMAFTKRSWNPSDWTTPASVR